MRNTFARAAVVLAALAPVATYAQGRGERRPGPPGPGGPGFGAAVFMDPIEPAKGAPFEARAVDEHTQTLSDGNRIARKTIASVWRDSEGRTRRERDGRVFIDDPVAGTGYVLDPATKTAMERPPFAGHRPPDRPRGGASESLGARTIEGLKATGTRDTFTIPAGQIGNEKPIDVVSERWYSDDLLAVVMSTHRDPRTGQDTHRLTAITRGEPDKSLFEVPEGYVVRQGPPPFLRGPGPGRPGERQ
jgi:hypothetical protein